MSMNIIERINYGYSHLEPIMVGLMAMHKNFLLIGRHGAGKSRLAKVLSQGYGKRSYVIYDATKDDLISVAGIPNPQAIQQGTLTFTPHQRSIWDKSTIVVDEITRASRENQNMWMEILEERTCFGVPLSYRSLIATANPESYAAAFRLDEALLDRFYAVIPIPDLQEGMHVQDLEQLLNLSIQPQPEIEPETIARIFSEIQSVHAGLVEDGTVMRVLSYCARIMTELLQAQMQLDEESRTYISPRTYARSFPETILAVAAYHIVAGTTEPLQTAASDAVRYCLATKYRLNDGYLEQLHQTARGLLQGGAISEAEQMRFAIASLRSFEERLAYLQDNRERIAANLKADELEKFLGTMLQGASAEGEKEKLVHLRKELDEVGYTGDILRQVDGNLILTLNSAISTFFPILNQLKIKPGGKTAKAWQQVQRFKELIDQGSFIRLQSTDAVKLKAFIIDVYEEDIEPTEENILEMFNSIDLE
jgi:MoxR-like ATPase